MTVYIRYNISELSDHVRYANWLAAHEKIKNEIERNVRRNAAGDIIGPKLIQPDIFDAAYEKWASHLFGVGHERNAMWRHLERERRLCLGEDYW